MTSAPPLFPIPTSMSERNPEFSNLMMRILEGDKDAASELYFLYGPHILKAVRRRLHPKLRSKFDSLDFVQDVWASFFRRIPEGRNFAGPEELILFLATMARNKVVQTVRARMLREKHNVNREVPPEQFPQGIDGFFANQKTPSEAFMDREAWDQFLKKQPLAYRRIFLLLREGKSSSTIADELGISQRTVNRVLRKIVPGKPK
jgi:RNA polymerase sigma factor (sigma-70 family)